MDSKKRVLNAFNKLKSDRVPMDYSSNPAIHSKIEKALGVNGYEDVLKAFDIDFRTLWVPFKGKKYFEDIKGINVNPVFGYRTKYVETESGGYDDYCDFPLKGADSETIANFPMADADDFDYSQILTLCKSYKEYGIGVGGPGYCDILNSTGMLTGMEDLFINLALKDEGTLKYINRKCEMQLKMLERTVSAGKGNIDFIWLGEDLGSQEKPLISLDMYRALIKPLHEKFLDFAKSVKLPVMFHTCGASSWVYEDFISMGVKAVDTLQPEAAGMSPKELVSKFGGRLSFHGCISTAGALAYKNVPDVENTVRETLDIMKPTQSYMLSPTHMIQDNTPVENVIALYKYGKKYGKY